MGSLSQRVGDHNAQMAKYNKFVACINIYMTNVQADTDVIQAIVNKAIAEGNND